MALNPTTLATGVKNRLFVDGSGFSETVYNSRFIDALCAAIVAEIVANAQVVPTALTVLDPVSGVLPVVGTGTIV